LWRIYLLHIILPWNHSLVELKFIHCENKYWLLTNKCVCLCATKIYLNAKNKKTRYLLTKWKLCEEKNHSGAAKPRNSIIQKQSKLQSTRTHKTYCSSYTFDYDTKPIVNASQPSLLLEGVFDGFLYLSANP
jgi:hypothetical protein